MVYEGGAKISRQLWCGAPVRHPKAAPADSHIVASKKQGTAQLNPAAHPILGAVCAAGDRGLLGHC